MEDFPANWRVSNFQNEFFPYALKYALYMVTAHGYTFKVNKGPSEIKESIRGRCVTVHSQWIQTA